MMQVATLLASKLSKQASVGVLRSFVKPYFVKLHNLIKFRVSDGRIMPI